MKYILAIFLTATAYAEPVYVCSTPFMSFQLAQPASCSPERTLLRDFKWLIAARFTYEAHAPGYPHIRGQSLRAAIREAQRAASCGWRELRGPPQVVCDERHCEGSSSSGGGGELP